MKNVIIVIKGLAIGMCIMLALWLTSCAANKTCHGNGRKYHVDRSVRKAQSRPYAYRY
jgi:hypothetical protein